jgi:adenylyltransferase/sulfurtransferase
MSDAREADRYARQTVLPELGRHGQRRLGESTVAVVGVGALGSVAAELLARAGIAALRLIDRDCVETTNLHRQSLFTEEDAAAASSKAEAAAGRLRAINRDVAVEPLVRELGPRNATQLLEGADLALDGSDNFATRYALNEAALRLGIPWVHGAATATHGIVLPIGAEGSPCFRCYQPGGTRAPERGCAVAGVLAATTHMVAAQQVALGMQLLLGEPVSAVARYIDPWYGLHERLELTADPDCPSCGRGAAAAAGGARTAAGLAMPQVEELCGEDAVRIRPEIPRALDLAKLSAGLPREHVRAQSDSLLRFHADGAEVTLFADGRALVRGAKRTEHATRIYREYLGG